MTIFVKTSQELIERVLIKSIEDSIADDKSMLFSWWRDTSISEEQRKITRDLQKIIAAFLNKESDKHSLETLKTIMSKIDTDVEEYRKTQKWDRGHLNATLTGINSNLDRFYNKISALKINPVEPVNEAHSAKKSFSLLDIVDDEDPFNILCAHAVYYLGEHILCPPEDGVFIKIANSVCSYISESSAIQVRAQKEDCLIHHLLACKKKIDGLDKDGDDYQILRKTFVIDEIKAILRDNAAICEESKPISTIPVQVTAFAVARIKAPGMKPSRGRLKVAMENALEEIGEVLAPQQQTVAAL